MTHTVRSIIPLAAGHLQKMQVVSPRREAEELLAFVLKVDRMELYFNYDLPLEEKEVSLFRSLIKRRGEREPLEYILGEIEFGGLKLSIGRDVLIPRRETEILFEKGLKKIKEKGAVGKSLWDICCGSGCLGLAAKKKLPELEVSLSDSSKEALVVAEKNATFHQLEVHAFLGDLLSPFKGKKSHFLFCNPPYIAEDEYLTLEKEVIGFEPKKALVSGPSGLEFYERLGEELPSYLHPGALVFLEIGLGQGEKIQKIFSAPCWKQVFYERDWSGIDRFFFLEMAS